jgi:DNA repair protein SbcD/Mre11
MPRILHFADAHIDMANYGRRDAETGLPLRVLDFLKSLDTIVDTAVDERVDLVIFAGDAYKDRTPAPTFQREWERRIMRLSQAGIPTLLLIGNHDLSPTVGRATAMQEFETLAPPHVKLISRPTFLTPADLEGLPLQVACLPWVSRSALMANLELPSGEAEKVFNVIEERFDFILQNWIEAADPSLPLILTAHASVEGAVYGGERSVLLGGDLTLPGSLVRDPQLDYVALGHIHKAQNLNGDHHPPVIYPGSIERVDFGEAADDKYFVIANVERGHTDVEWRKLDGVRPFIDSSVRLETQDGVGDQLLAALPPAEQLAGAIVRLTIEYPRDWDALIDEAPLREHAAGAFEFHISKRPLATQRGRISPDAMISSLSELALLDLYWDNNHSRSEDKTELQKLAADVIRAALELPSS